MAEAQALEEARRRDPVKLGSWVAGFLVVLVGLWIMEKQFEIHWAKGDLARLDAQVKANEAQYNGVIAAKARTAAIEGKIAALEYLKTNRFLWGPVLNALQQTVVDQVQVSHFVGLQIYEREPPKSLAGKTIPGTATFEKVKLSITAKDYSAKTDGYKNYEDTLNHFDFFAKKMGGREGFTIEGAPGPKSADAPGSPREFRVFTLTNQLPEIRREDR